LKKRRIKGLRRRWMASIIVPLTVLMLLGCLVAHLSITSYYYNSARQGLLTKAQASADYFSSLSISSYNQYYQTAYRYTETFDQRDKLELQFISTAGRVQVSSYGPTAGTYVYTQDITDAIAGGEPAWFIGKDSRTGESILAVSGPISYNGTVVGVMRYVTSLEIVDRQIWSNSAVIFAVVLLLLLVVYVSNWLFIRNVVRPVGEITAVSRRIADGSYGIQLENGREDEIGELIDSINSMSARISQNEKMQQEFISSVSHELRTPLTAINGWGETLLADNGSDPIQTRRGISIILKETRRLSTMVEELLDFSKMQDGRFSLQMEPTDVQAEFEDAIFTYRELFRQEGIEVTYQEPEDLIDPMDGDPERLKQVFCNLLDNAAKHGGSGKRIDTAIWEEGGRIFLQIRDHGPGIPAEELPFVKQRFYKGSSKARGSGIGLAVCEEIIQRHNGRLEIENAQGGGAVVTITLERNNRTNV